MGVAHGRQRVVASMSGIELSGVEHVEAHIIDTDPQRLAEQVRSRMADHLSPEQNRLLVEAFRLSMGVSDEESFEDVERRFLEAKAVAGRTQRTIKMYRQELDAFRRWCGLTPQAVDVDTIRSYLAHKRESGCGEVTIDNTRRVLSSFFNWCDAEEIVHKSVMRRVESVKCPKRRKKPFSDSDIVKLREACDTARDRALIEFLLSTGARVGEVVGLDREDIDLQNGTCEVFGKGRKERRCYLNEEASYYVGRYLEARTDASPAAFVSNHKVPRRLGIHGVEGIIHGIGKRAGVGNCHPHRFRRTMATNALRRGMPIEQVQRLLGHENVNTTLIYSMVDEESVAYSARRLLS